MCGVLPFSHSHLAGTALWNAAVDPLLAPGETADIFRLKLEVYVKQNQNWDGRKK